MASVCSDTRQFVAFFGWDAWEIASLCRQFERLYIEIRSGELRFKELKRSLSR